MHLLAFLAFALVAFAAFYVAYRLRLHGHRVLAAVSSFVISLFAPVAAFAQTIAVPGTVTSDLSSIGTDVAAIGGAIIVVVAIAFAFKLMKRGL